MEMPSSNCPNAKDDDLTLILAQIKQYNESVKDALEESHPQNHQDFKELMCLLIPLIRDLSKSLCAKLSGTTETLQNTLHILKELQEKFKDLNTTNDYINYLIMVKQILEDTEGSLKLSEEHLENIDAESKLLANENYNNDAALRINSEHINGIAKSEENVITTDSSEFSEDTSQERKIETNVQREEPDNLIKINDNTDETNEPECMDKNRFSVTEEQAHLHNTNITCEQIINPQPEQRRENAEEPSSSEVIVNGTRHKADCLSDSGAWTYKEFTLQDDEVGEDLLACFIRAPSSILQKLQCRFMDDISSLVVSNSEELVSKVLNISCLDDHLKIPYPINISIPFSSHYRGSYKDIMVKVIDKKFNSSYLTPNSLEGRHGEHKGSFAEVKVYKLGTFSVVSCLKKEKFNVLKKGLSLKLSVDSRISLNYPPGCFSSSVIVQFKVQPIDTSLISVLKAKHDIYHPVVSSSPLIQVKQPSVQAFHKPVTVFLPCPPNPEKKKTGDDAENRRAASAAGSKTTGTHQIRAVSASVRKHGDNPSELLKLLALKEDQWIILDDIVVKNVQNGLVSLEVTEYMQRFIVVRLSSAMDNTHLIKFIQSLEYAIYSSMVNVVLYRKNNNFNKVIAELVPSKELNWEINALMEAGYTGPPEPSEAIILQEGDQIHFTFCGNIAASDVKESGKTFKLTFHSQRMQKKCMDISVVDEFGNYSSPHFKGTVAFYKISKEEITEGYKSGLSTDNYIQQRTPVCKLSVTLPKVEKNISRPSSTKLLTVGPKDMLWDSVLKWVAQELSEEDAAELLHSLPIRRSTIQLVRLKSPNNLTNQIYELLSLWKKRLPTSTDKFRLLGRHLQKSGRSDLVEQMKVKWEPNMLGLATL
ncbi:death domain-containing protein 1 isoform X1 [Ranitomeya imitator]|uniref:death domain-containing protein 1 isoform X1 n=1 Tax=Ranitomeya imitator TaxID=111125 RepID=UPI0037E99745